MPADAPTGFVRRAWRPIVTGADGRPDRRATGSSASSPSSGTAAGRRRLGRRRPALPQPRGRRSSRRRWWPGCAPRGRCRTGVPEDPTPSRRAAGRLEAALPEVARLAAAGELPEAGSTRTGARSAAPGREPPETRKPGRLYAMLPRVRHRPPRRGRRLDRLRRPLHAPADRPAAAREAGAADRDPRRRHQPRPHQMAEACPGRPTRGSPGRTTGTSATRPTPRALAALSTPTTASRSPRTGATATPRPRTASASAPAATARPGPHQRELRPRPGRPFYTHVSDRYAPFHTKVIAATAARPRTSSTGCSITRAELEIREHYTDTGGAHRPVFGLCHLLGFRFAPRIRDLADRRL